MMKYEIKAILPNSEKGFMNWLLKYIVEKGTIDFSIEEM